MRCHQVKHLLPLFLDGQLSEKQASKVKVHLDGCLACSKELNLLKETWDLLGQWQPIPPSPNFKANFWQRLLQEQEEASLERKRIFVLPKLFPGLAPAFATLVVILITSILLTNFFSGKDIQRLALIIKDENISMLKELDLAEELDVIKNIHILEEFELIDSIELWSPTT